MFVVTGAPPMVNSKRLPRRIVAAHHKVMVNAATLVVQQLHESIRLLQLGKAQGRLLGEIAGLEWVVNQGERMHGYLLAAIEERLFQLKEKL